MGAYMAAHLGERIDREDFNAQIDSIFGASSHARMELKCDNNNLAEIYVHLPKVLEKSDALSSIIMRAQAQGKQGNGPEKFRVDPIGQ